MAEILTPSELYWRVLSIINHNGTISSYHGPPEKEHGIHIVKSKEQSLLSCSVTWQKLQTTDNQCITSLQLANADVQIL